MSSQGPTNHTDPFPQNDDLDELAIFFFGSIGPIGPIDATDRLDSPEAIEEPNTSEITHNYLTSPPLAITPGLKSRKPKVAVAVAASAPASIDSNLLPSTQQGAQAIVEQNNPLDFLGTSPAQPRRLKVFWQ